MGFQPSNVMTKAFILKFVELFFVFIVFLLFRVGRGGDVFYWGAGPQLVTEPLPTTTTATTTATTTTTTTLATTTTTSNAAFDKFLDESEFEQKYNDEFVSPDPYATPELFMSERAENDLIFGILASVGYFYITIVLMIGILMGDRQKFTMFLFNAFGFLFFIAIGSEQIDVYKKMPTGKSKARGMGAMAILTSFTFLVDTVFSVMDIMNGDED
eukprot:GFUD01031972.1.p1 GENE.GFUD01031972.1~~GFUD01031972.1.p1  ORF type:complete len:214 (-),score=53.80 GFUD01031972.1:33-674(-)